MFATVQNGGSCTRRSRWELLTRRRLPGSALCFFRGGDHTAVRQWGKWYDTHKMMSSDFKKIPQRLTDSTYIHSSLPSSSSLDEETNLAHSHAFWLDVHWRGFVSARYGPLQRHTGPSLQTACSRLPHGHSAQKLPLRACRGLRWLQGRPTTRCLHKPEQGRTHGWPLQVQEWNHTTLLFLLKG